MELNRYLVTESTPSTWLNGTASLNLVRIAADYTEEERTLALQCFCLVWRSITWSRALLWCDIAWSMTYVERTWLWDWSELVTKTATKLSLGKNSGSRENSQFSIFKLWRRRQHMHVLNDYCLLRLVVATAAQAHYFANHHFRKSMISIVAEYQSSRTNMRTSFYPKPLLLTL